ncbi:MAG: NADH-quinone oxidoreductase subunit I [Micropruina sp.]|nr:MAG: NADH-quinone oxidoreductase subunit I [Micropruina sp.]
MSAVVVALGRRRLRIAEGPRLLAGIADGPSLEAHRRQWPAVRAVPLEQLATLAEGMQLRGRGGAGFPFATKLRTAAGRGAVVVVNVSEGEPASFKDAALALVRPHLILDGAELAASALGARTVHVVLPGEHAAVRESLLAAIAERDGGPAFRTHVADQRFVAGQARAVLELMAGRPNLPVTSWQPEAVAGHRGKPTLLSNAETYAQLAAAGALGSDGFAAIGLASEPGTTLLTLNGESEGPVVREAAFGTPWSMILAPEALNAPILVGGFHGAWLQAGALSRSEVSRAELLRLGANIGAGIVLPLAVGACPVDETARVVRYLAGESAGRCGPCLNGLPALADAMDALADGSGRERVAELTGLLPGRGACAHPDGTVRLVASLLRSFEPELDLHAAGRCGFAILRRSA